MKQTFVARATLGRLPIYLQYLKSLSAGDGDNISATAIAKALGLGKVQVRKDLSSVSGTGKPKIGYVTSELISNLERYLDNRSRAVIVGAGKLGRALLDYDGFEDYGLEIAAAFDNDSKKLGVLNSGKEVFPMECLEKFCKKENIHIGIITVCESSAQTVCDSLIKCGITAIWSFAPCMLTVPEGILLRQENLALSLAHLSSQIGEEKQP